MYVNPWSLISHWSWEIKRLWNQRTPVKLNGSHSKVKFTCASIISSRSTPELQRATIIPADEAVQCPGTYNEHCPQPAEERSTGRLNDLLQSAQGAIVQLGLNTVFPDSSFCVSVSKALSWLCSVTLWRGWDWKWHPWDVGSGIIHSCWDPPLVFSPSPVLQNALLSNPGSVLSGIHFPRISALFSLLEPLYARY